MQFDDFLDERRHLATSCCELIAQHRELKLLTVSRWKLIGEIEHFDELFAPRASVLVAPGWRGARGDCHIERITAHLNEPAQRQQ
jgi:hypothetical protein